MWRVALGLLCLSLAGCASSAPAPPPTPPPAAAQAPASQPSVAQKAPVGAPSPQAIGPRSFKIGSLLTMGLAPALIAQARGYFNQEGLNVELVSFTNGAEMVPALATGQIDAGLSVAPSAALVNAVGRGMEVKIVASNGTIKAHRNIGNIIVRKDLAPTSGALDLKTLAKPIKAVATVEASLPHAIVLLEAEKAGLAATDVNMSFMGLPEMNAALQAKQVDIAASYEPLITIAEQQGIAVRWRETAVDFPDVPFSTVVYGPNLLTKDPDGGVRLMRAYLQGVRDYEDAFTKGRDRDAVASTLADPLQTAAPLFQAVQDGGGLAYIDPNGAVNVDTLKPVLDLWVKTGLVQGSFDLKRLVDPSPVELAVQTMGVYR